MRPIHHAILSSVIAGGSYAATSSLPIAAATFVAGTLIDADHLVDSRGKLQLSPSFYEKQDKLFVLLHSYELLVPLWILASVFGFIPLALWLTVAFVVHLLTDQIAYRPHLLFYFLTFRAMRGFRVEGIKGREGATSLTTALYVLTGTYILLHIFAFTSYTPTPQLPEAGKLLAASQWLVPTLLLAVLVPRVNKWLTPILKVRFWTCVGFGLVAACVTLELMDVPGLWWAWSTLGLLTFIVILVANALSSKLGQVNALLLGAMVTLLGIASWEILYQTGLFFYHNFFGSGAINYIIVVAENLTWVIPALIVTLVLYMRYGNFVRANIITLACIALTVVLTSMWFADGMQIPLVWYKGVGPFVTDANWWAISISRGSQVFWVLGIATLFLRRQR